MAGIISGAGTEKSVLP